MKIVLSGAMGAMGTVIINNCQKFDGKVVAGIDQRANDSLPFPHFNRFEDCDVLGDVVIDFSHPSNLPGLLEYLKRTNTPGVICTTGFSDSDVDLIKDAAKSVPIFFSYNTSLCVSLLISLAQRAAEVLGQSFDIEIIEKHHHRKVDAPSGTAVMIYNGIKKALDTETTPVYERHSRHEARQPGEIGIYSVRAGNIVGEHEVIFAGEDEILTISHSARSRAIFAMGALRAAQFLCGKPAGLYDMSHIIG